MQYRTFSRQVLLAAILLPLITGCGKRPSLVEAPDDDNPHRYPVIYPDPGTDPPGSYAPNGAAAGGVTPR